MLFEHLQQVEKATGKWPKDYEPLPPPEGTEHIWNIFWELRGCSAAGFGGPNRITFVDIDAWGRVRSTKLENFIVDIILRMDTAYMDEVYRERRN